MRTRATMLAFLAWAAMAPGGGAAAQPVPGAKGRPAAGPLATAADVDVGWRAGLDGLVADLPSLQGLRGPARVRLLATGAADGRGIDRVVQVDSEDAWFGRLPLGRLSARIETRAGAGAATVAIGLDGPIVQATAMLQADVRLDTRRNRLAWGPGPLAGTVQVQGIDLARATEALPFLALGGTVQGSVRLDGEAARPAIEARLLGVDVSWRGEAVGAVRLEVRLADGSAEVAAGLGAEDDPVATARARVPVSLDLRRGTIAWRDAERHELEVSAKGLSPTRLRPLWRAPAGADFRVDAGLRGAGSLDDFRLDGTLEGTYRSGDAEPVTVTARMEAGPARQVLDVVLGKDLARLAVATRIPLVAVRRAGTRQEPSGLEGVLDLALPLQLAAPFLPDALDRPAGMLEGHVEASGTLGTPILKGGATVQGATATLLPLNRRLEAVDVDLSVEGDRLEVRRAAARSGPGRLEVAGAAHLVATAPDADPKAGLWGDWRLSGAFEARADSFPVVQSGLAVSLIRGRAGASFEARPGDAKVVLELADGDVRLTKESLPKVRGIPVNPAVRVTDWLGRETGQGLLAGAGHLRLELEIEPRAHVHGEGMDLQVGGRMVLDRKGPVVRVDGGLDADPGGRFRLFGNRFEIREGRFTLAEGHLLRRAEAGPGQTAATALMDPDQPPRAMPLEPVIELVARGRPVGTDVLVKVMGPVRRPELMLASVPPLPEYQLLTLLIMGRADAVDDRNGEVRRQATALVERFHNPSLKRQLFDRLGVDKVGLGFGKSVKQPIVAIGKQITRQLYVETLYHHNAPPDTNQVQGHVEYRVDRNWTLDTTFGDRGEGGLGAFYTTRFGGPAPPPPPDEAWGMVARGARPDGDGDGVEDPFDLCPDRPEDRDGWRDDDGCPDPDNDGDGIPDEVDAARDDAETLNGFQDEDGTPDVAPPRPVAIEGRLRTALFEAGSAMMDRASRAALKVAGTVLRELRDIRVSVEGHSDDLGPPGVRQQVSQARAAAARAALGAAGVPARGARTSGIGDARPSQANASDEARARNRRVEFRVESMPAP